MISIIIPLYNKGEQISSTLQSVLNQTYQDFEIIIVNDGSTDNSDEKIREFSDPRIRVINQINSGVSRARNNGINEATGEFVALLDGDDEWEPDYLETQWNLINKYPQCDLYCTSYKMRSNERSEKIASINRIPFTSEDGILSNYFEVASCSHPPICSISIAAKKSAFLSIGGFPIGIKSGEDLITWARLAARYKIAYSLKPLAIFNVEGYEMKERPKRIPAEEDYVGQELVKLKDEFSPRGINRYISHWHKMRSSIYMRLGMRGKSIREAMIGLRYNPLNYKLFAYIIINMLPSKFQPF